MFKKDFFDFLQIIKRSSDDSEIKKKYLFMVKKYHPDTAPNGFESIYNEYMILINKAYSKDKTNVKEITFDEKNTNNIYADLSSDEEKIVRRINKDKPLKDKLKAKGHQTDYIETSMDKYVESSVMYDMTDEENQYIMSLFEKGYDL